MAKFGIAYLIASLFTDSKLTPVFIVCIFVVGAIAIDSTPKEDNPQIVVPGATVIVNYPGATAEEVEQLVVRPIEKTVKLISGVSDYYSTASHSRAEFAIFFEVGEDQEGALVRLHDRFDKISNLLPIGATKPIINSINIADVPIMTITMASKEMGEDQLKILAEALLDDLLMIDDVSSAYIKGGLNGDVVVEVDPAKLLASKVGLNEVVVAVRDASITLPLGPESVGDVSHMYDFGGGLTSVADVESVAVRASVNKGEILLRDIARVSDMPEKWRETISLFGFGKGEPEKRGLAPEIMPAVTIAIAKKRDTNSVMVSDEVRERLAKFVAEHDADKIFAEVTRDDGSVARATSNELFHHLAIAIAVVFIITYMFLGFKAACVVGFTVPLVLGLTIATLSVMGLTLNRVSLLALIIALGMLVDDAIVVLENIYSTEGRNAEQVNKKNSVIGAAAEVGNPTNIATLAIVIVFISTLVITEMPGEFFYPVSVVVPIAMLASLFIAYSVVPWLSFNFLDFSKHSAPIERYLDSINAVYKRMLMLLLDNASVRRTSLYLSVFLLLAVMVMPAWQFLRPSGVGGEPPLLGVLVHSMPQIDTNTLNIVIEVPPNRTLMYSHQVAQEVAAGLAEKESVTNFQIWLGESGVEDFNGILRGTSSREGHNIAEIRVNLRNKSTRAYTSMDVARELREMVSEIEARFSGVLIRVVEDPPGPPARAGLLAEVYGDNSEELREIALGLSDVFQNTWGVIEVSDSVFEDIHQYTYKVDERALRRYGVSRAELYSVLNLAINGADLGRIVNGGARQEKRILLKFPFSYVDTLVPLQNIKVRGPGGVEVPLSELVTLEKTILSHPILHKNGSPVAYVTGEMGESVPLYGVLDISNQVKEKGIGYNFLVNDDNVVVSADQEGSAKAVIVWEGAYDQVMQAFAEMALALFISLLMVYVLLVYYYKSFAIPVIAMLAIPFALIGVFPAHWAFSELFTSTSMVGVIALAGVVVRNSLLIFDFVFQSLRNGEELRSALIDCTVARLRPIVLTAASIFLGSAILIKDPLFSGLGLSLVFGTVASTIMSLFLTPVCLYFYLKKQGNSKFFLQIVH